MKKIILPWEAHPDRDQVWYDGLKERMTEDEIATEVDRRYVSSVSGRVFTSFNPRKHVSEKPIPVNPHKEVYRIWDFGGTNAVLYGQIDSFGRRRLLFERLLGSSDKASTTPEQIAVALEDSANHFKGCRFIDICDPAGSYNDHRGKDTDVQMLNAKGMFPRYQTIMTTPAAERKKRSIKLFNMDLQSCPGGDDAFVLYLSPDRKEGCPYTFNALMGGYCYKKDRSGNFTDVIDEKHPHEDVVDCVLYWYLETKRVDDEGFDKLKITHSKRDVNPYTGY